MKKRFWLAATVGLLSLAAAGASSADADLEAGKARARACLGCHAIPGYANVYPNYQVPKLAGQHPEYIITALKAYSEGLRPHATMHAQAADLSAEEMTNIAAYLAQSCQ